METEDLDVDFDFRSMLSTLDESNSFSLDMLSPQPPQQQHRSNGPPLHPRSQAALSMGEILDSRLFKADAPWSFGTSRPLTAAPPPSNFNSNGARGNRSGSGAIISNRLRAASDMHQQGFLTSEEKSLMKDLILSRNPRFKEEFANAEKTNNWFALQTFLRSHNRMSPANSLSMVIDDLATEFEALATPPPPAPASSHHFDNMLAEASASAANAGMTKAVRKRMASQSTPVARPKKTTSSSKKDYTKKTGEEEATKTEPKPMAAPKMAAPSSSAPVPGSIKSLAAMDDKDLEIEAEIAAADGDSDQVAKIRKNERERRRRLAVSNGFDELFDLLKLPQAIQIDKVSILRKAIDRIRELESRVNELEKHAQ